MQRDVVSIFDVRDLSGARDGIPGTRDLARIKEADPAVGMPLPVPLVAGWIDADDFLRYADIGGHQLRREARARSVEVADRPVGVWACGRHVTDLCKVHECQPSAGHLYKHG